MKQEGIFDLTTSCPQIKKLGTALARLRGEDEQVEGRNLRQRLSVLLLMMRGNVSVFVNRVPEGEIVNAMVDGVEKMC